MRKYLIVGDFHCPFHDEKVIKLLYTFIKDLKPDKLYLAGDIIDFWEISKFSKKPLNGTELQKDIDQTYTILEKLRSLMGNNEIVYLQGNHEFRLEKYLYAKAPEISGLRNLKFTNLLPLSKLGISFMAVDSNASRFQDNYVQIENIYIGHFDKVNQKAGYTAQNLIASKGVSVIQAHVHRFGFSAKRLMDNRLLVGYENGCCCSLKPCYTANPDWQHAFCVMFLYRDGYYYDMSDQRETELIVSKHREGPTGKVDLLFLPEQGKFGNVVKQELNGYARQ